MTGTSMLAAMRKYMQKAVEAREKFYAGLEQTKRDFEDGSGQFANAMSVDDAQYNWSGTMPAKQLISDNQWHMKQAIMFGIAHVAITTVELLQEQKRTNALLEELVRGNRVK